MHKQDQIETHDLDDIIDQTEKEAAFKFKDNVNHENLHIKS